MRVAQSGLQKRGLLAEGPRANGLLLRGVVMATYVLDDPNHPATTLGVTDAQDNPVGVYCDVMIYSNMPGFRCYAIPKVLVLQDRGSLHNGRIWKPRATTLDVTAAPLDPDTGTQFANMDGDHVLIGFIDNALNQPVIIGGLPHPSHDAGVDSATALPGHRRQLLLADGDPDWMKHHGVVYGVDGLGNFHVDSRWGNDGTLDQDGAEPAPPTDGKGAQVFDLPQDAEQRIEFWDMTDPATPASVSVRRLTKDTYELNLGGGTTLKLVGQDADAVLTLGDGTKHATIVETLQLFYELGIKAAFDNHTHATGVGPSGPPTPKAIMDPWDSTIASTKVAFPDG